MADSVQYALDGMVNDLQNLCHRGIFSETEVKAILAKRKEFEYRLRRFEARKMDFMRYVEHETNLEALRSMRTRRIHKSRRRRKDFRADSCCLRLVRSIFDRAVAKFPADVDLWLHYIDFLAQQKHTRPLGNVFARALQLHPRNAGLWVKAASWEFFEASSASSARALMQRALRINPTARNLWLQYFRLEFFYVEKLKGRREVLGLDEGEDGGGGDSDGDGDGDGSRVQGESMDIPSLEEEGKGDDGPSFEGVKKASATPPSPAKDERGPRVVMNETARRFYRGAVPLAIFRAAIKTVPNDVAFRALFLRCCVEDFPKLGREVAKAVLTSVAEDFPQSCEAWELRASYPLLLADWGEQVKKRGRSHRHPMAPIVQECVDIFEEAVSELGDREPDMWVRYAEFVRKMVEDELDRAEGQVEESPGGDRGRSAKFVLTLSRDLKRLLERAVSHHLDSDMSHQLGGKQGHRRTDMKLGLRELATEKVESAESLAQSRARSLETLVLGLADACLALSEVSSARETLVKATERLPMLPGPWLRRAALERRLESLGLDVEPHEKAPGQGEGCAATEKGSTGTLSSSQTLRQGLRSVPCAQAGYAELWRELLAGLVMEGADRREIARTFRAAIEACGTTGGGAGEAHGEFLVDYVRWCAATEGLEAAHDALRWARKSLMLAGTSAAKAYMVLVELERTLRGSWGSAGSSGNGGGDEVDADRRSASTKRVRELFEEMTSKFGKEMPGLWEDYVQFELKEHNVKRANAVRWRAERAAEIGGGGALKRRR